MQGPASCTEEVDTKGDEDNDESQFAAVLHGGVDDVGPVQLWNAVMKKYKVAQACEEELSKLNAKVEKTKRDELRERHALALAEAVDGIAALSDKEVYQRLSAWIAKDSESHESVKITHDSTFMSSRDPFFWCACFVRLFGRGDCQESCRDRRT